MTGFEAAESELLLLLDWYAAQGGDQGRNEAQTRFDLIDRLLAQALGWAPEDITVERHHDGTYSDYELGTPAILAVLEAKREGVQFELPAGSTERFCSLRSLASSSDDLRHALDQARAYAQARGIEIAIVCNGTQFVAFLASRTDGLAPENGDALVFDSLTDIAANFRVFWDYLSKPAAESRRLSARLQKNASAPPPEKLSKRLVDYPGFKNRNPIAAELQILGGLFIEDIVRDPALEEEFLRDCYCSSGALSQYALVGKQILESRYSIFFEKQGEVTAADVVTKSGLADEFKQDLVAAGLGKRPIILLGDVGVGKTTFVRHFIHVEAREVLKKSIALYIDFGNQPALVTDLKPYVLRELVRQLRDDYAIDVEAEAFVRGVYHGPLKGFRKGVWGPLADSDPAQFKVREIEFLDEQIRNEEAHLRKSIVHLLRGQSRQVVVFLDNVDQRPAQFQEEVFLIAQSLAATWSATVFVALRPETFYASRERGSLSGYQPRVFTIAPPRVDQVVQKRLRFARQALKDEGRLASFPDGLTLSSDRLDAYIGVLLHAFTSDQRIIEFVDNMSNGNVRRALDLVQLFVGSGHVDSEKILRVLDETGRYNLPLHEFVRAAVYGDYEYYEPGTSPIANLFDVSEPDEREYFLLPLVLALLDRQTRQASGEGFVAINRVFTFAQGLGFKASQLDFAIGRALNKGLVDSHPRPVSIDEHVPVSEITHLRLTSAGAYSNRRLLGMFQYLDAMAVDTPIVAPDVRQTIHNAESLAERLRRVRVLADYFDVAWEPFVGADLPFDWLARSAELREETARINERLDHPPLPLAPA